jgi:hypothetical protein
MKQILFFLISLFIFSFCLKNELKAQEKSNKIIMTPQDKQIVETILLQLKDDQKQETGLLVIKVGKLLLGTPYVASTLEVGGSEKMVVNLRGLDCTTFAENCLALARTIHKSNPTFNDFVEELKFIRYRDGILKNYPSRLHYFSDWIYNNDQKKVVKSVSKEIADIAIENKVNFMSNNPQDYPVLKTHPDFVKEIALQENVISKRETWYIPKNRFSEFEHSLNDGDIIGITTKMPGMDISHVIIAIRVDGRVHLLNASSKQMKVVISDETLEKYLNNYKSITGIMVARPL